MPAMQIHNTCDRCRFWLPMWAIKKNKPQAPSEGERRSTRGHCHRYAPHPSAFTLQWPSTEADHWCGDFKQWEHERRKPKKMENGGGNGRSDPA